MNASRMRAMARATVSRPMPRLSAIAFCVSPMLRASQIFWSRSDRPALAFSMSSLRSTGSGCVTWLGQMGRPLSSARERLLARLRCSA